MITRDQEGSIAVETAIVAPALLVLMLLVVYAGRASQADADVRSAAARAARAAAAASDPAAAEVAATSVVDRNLGTGGVICQALDVDVDASDFGIGGSVTVTVSCQVANGDIALVAVPGTRWSSASSTQPIDRFRGGDR